jgi:hypothetical protein
VEGKWIVFQPLVDPKPTGFIFYPGGLVDPRAYAPQARAIAEKGYPVVIVPMPLNLTVFGASRASEVMAEFPDIAQWVIGGHSLGGKMAANFVANHPGAVEGLIFWGAAPTSDDLVAEQTGLIVYSLYGTLDGLTTPAEVLAAAPLLPPGTRFIPIEGGNHAQFGWYSDQSGDNPSHDQPRRTAEADCRRYRRGAGASRPAVGVGRLDSPPKSFILQDETHSRRPRPPRLPPQPQGWQF